jgi:hypothetical protein
MKKTGNKKLFLLRKALMALILCGNFLSCLQAVYDTGLLDYVPSAAPKDIKSASFSVVQNSNILIIKLKGGAFKASLSIAADRDKFLLNGNQLTGAVSLVRDSDTQVRITVPLPSGGGYWLIVKKEALMSPVNRVSVEAVKSGWLPISDDTANNVFGSVLIWSIGYGDGKFVATGAGGKIAFYSSDTGRWTAILPGTSAGQSGFWDTDTIRAVAHGNGKFVAAGYGAKMAFSANGIDWSGWTESAFNGESILAIVYGDGKFIAAGDRNKIRYSGNGDSGTWFNVQKAPFGENINILGLAYGEFSSFRRFVAVGSGGQIAWSGDGTNWTAASTVFGTTQVNAVTFGNGKFIAAGDEGKMAYSLNGETWTPVTSALGTSGILSVCYGSGKFAAAGHDGKMAESADGVSWTPVSQNHFTGGDQIRAIAYGGGMFVAGGNVYTGSAAKMIYGY